MSTEEIFFFVVQLAWFWFQFYYPNVTRRVLLSCIRGVMVCVYWLLCKMWELICSELSSVFCVDRLVVKPVSKPTPFAHETKSAPRSSSMKYTAPIPTFVRQSPSAVPPTNPQYQSAEKTSNSTPNNTAPFFGSNVSTNQLPTFVPSYVSTSSVEAIHVEAVAVDANTSTVSPVVSAARNAMEKVAKVVHHLDLPTRVSVTPQKLIQGMCAIQGIHLDPSDMDHAVDQIVKAVGNSGGVCDGEESYDLFINYRVSTEKEVAMKLYLELKLKGNHRIRSHTICYLHTPTLTPS